MQYYCSEELGTYQSYPYLNDGYYLNSFYVPGGWVLKGNLQDYLYNKFYNSSASGRYFVDVYIEFEIYTQDVFLDTVEANRVYNEFICQLNQFTINIPTYEKYYRIDFTVDYFLCCNGSSCCYPKLIGQGEVYWN